MSSGSLPRLRAGCRGNTLGCFHGEPPHTGINFVLGIGLSSLVVCVLLPLRDVLIRPDATVTIFIVDDTVHTQAIL